MRVRKRKTLGLQFVLGYIGFATMIFGMPNVAKDFSFTIYPIDSGSGSGG